MTPDGPPADAPAHATEIPIVSLGPRRASRRRQTAAPRTAAAVAAPPPVAAAPTPIDDEAGPLPPPPAAPATSAAPPVLDEEAAPLPPLGDDAALLPAPSVGDPEEAAPLPPVGEVEEAAPLPPPPDDDVTPARGVRAIAAVLRPDEFEEEKTNIRPSAAAHRSAGADFDEDPATLARKFDERPTPPVAQPSRFSPVEAARPIGDLVLDYLAFEKAVPRALPPSRRASLVDLFGAPAGGPEAAPQPDAADDDIVAGRYRIEEQLGEGGMGKVFRVRHLQLDKAFALKLIHVNANSSPRARELFYREAKLASSLAHPNIVTIVDFGEDPRRGTFMVMELVEGEPLSVHLHRLGRLAVKPAIDIILQIAEALHYIHGRQIVHCDIKPENILLCRLPSTERRKFQVKLLDFGLARTGAASARLTQNIEGTPAYLAPERIRSQAPQASMDIYSLGVLSYELVTGRLPFDGTMYEIMTAHCQKPPPPIRTFVPDGIDESFEALVMRALAKEPTDRQKDMAAFLYELRTVMDMLGMGRRRANPVIVREVRDRRERGVAVGYEVTPLPMAGVDADGAIVVANRAFALFCGLGGEASIEGKSLFETKLQAICPELKEWVRRVHADGSAQSLLLALRAPDGTEHHLALWLVPGTEDGGRIHLTLHALEA